MKTSKLRILRSIRRAARAWPLVATVAAMLWVTGSTCQ